jgi:purine-cytosine permease-like protein
VGILQLIGQIIGSAVSLYLAADMALRALAAFRLIDDRWLEPIAREGLGLVNPAFLAVTIIWALFAATVGTLAVRLVAAIMFSYQVFPALVIGGLVVWAMPGLPSYQPIAGMPPPGGPPISQPGLWSFVVGVQLILGFFAPHALIAADWGVASREKRDVRMGILVGVGAAALVLATLAMIGVAGARGRSVRALEAPGAPRVGPELGPAGSEADAVRTHVLQEARGLALERWTVRGVLSNQIGDWIGGALLLILGVGLLGPVCYAPHQMSRTVQELRPGASKLVGPVLGALAAIPLIAVGFPSRLDRVFALTGALFAPVIGILWADALIHRGRWPGPAAGWRWPGIAAWIAGAAVGSFPLLGPRFGWGDWSRFQPAALFGLIAAWFIYLITSGISPWRTAHVAKADAVGPQPAPPAESPIP